MVFLPLLLLLLLLQAAPAWCYCCCFNVLMLHGVLLMLQIQPSRTGKRSGSEGRSGDKMQPKKSLTCRLKPKKNCVKHGLPAALLLL